jgi:hypothetical protein
MPMMIRRCLIILTGGAVVALGAMAAPAVASTAALSAARQANSTAPTITPATSADPTPTGPTSVTVTLDKVGLDCFYPGVIYSVDTTGINVRETPDGSIEASIGDGRWFDSEWDINGVGPYHCITDGDVAGQQWVLGYPNYDSNIEGYVGLDYLYFVKYVT